MLGFAYGFWWFLVYESFWQILWLAYQMIGDLGRTLLAGVGCEDCLFLFYGFEAEV